MTDPHLCYYCSRPVDLDQAKDVASREELAKQIARLERRVAALEAEYKASGKRLEGPRNLGL